MLSVCAGVPNLSRTVSLHPYIECVFENDLVELDAAGTLAAAEANEHTLITAEVRRLHIAAHWADLHPGEAVPASRLPGTEHPVRLGGEGTPTVGGFAAAELGCVLRISDGSAARLIGDALDLRHRLPVDLGGRAGWAGAGLPGPTDRHRNPPSQRRAGQRGGCTASRHHLAPSRGAGCKPCLRPHLPGRSRWCRAKGG